FLHVVACVTSVEVSEKLLVESLGLILARLISALENGRQGEQRSVAHLAVSGFVQDRAQMLFVPSSPGRAGAQAAQDFAEVINVRAVRESTDDEIGGLSEGGRNLRRPIVQITGAHPRKGPGSHRVIELLLNSVED